MYTLSGPFQRSQHSFYNIEELELVDAIEKLGVKHPVSRGLRELLIYKKGPFEEQAKEVFISVPHGNGIRQGRAAACNGKEFYNRKLRIFNQHRTHSVTVKVSNSFPCPETDSDILKLIQISYADMTNLVGDSPLNSKEHGFAEILIDAL